MVENKLKVLLNIVIGSVLMAFSASVFIIPNDFVAGGTTGLAIVLQNYLGFDESMSIAVIYILAFVIGAIVLGRKFAYTTLACSIIYPICFRIFKSISVFQITVTNKLLIAFYAGVLMGAGVGLILKNGISSGGLDIVSLILNKKLKIPVAVSIYFMDCVILILQLRTHEIEEILYGIFIVILTSFLINYMIIIGKKKVNVIIISKNYEMIRRSLLFDVDVGLSLIPIESGYDKKNIQAILCVTSNKKLFEIEKVINRYDPAAFVMTSETSEVRGRGFTLKR